MFEANPRNQGEQCAAINLRVDFWPLSKAADRLAKGMWGSWKAPAAVYDAAAASAPKPAHDSTSPQQQDVDTAERNQNEELRNLRAGYVPRRACAAKRLWDAALKGEIAVYIVRDDCDCEPSQPQLIETEASQPHLNPESDDCESGPPRPAWPESPVRIPLDVLKRLIVPLETLPDHAIRPTLRAIGDAKLYVMLMQGRLVVQRAEFESWYEAERRKGDWPSQTAQTEGDRRGRPSKQTERLKDAILALVNQQRWDRTRPFTELVAVLKEDGQVQVPSIDTLHRLARRMVVEDGDTRLHQPIRVKRTRPARS